MSKITDELINEASKRLSVDAEIAFWDMIISFAEEHIDDCKNFY